MGNGEDRSTQALVEDTIAGDAEAFTLLVDRYRDAASAVAYSHLGGFDDVQDAVQEAFVHAYCNLRQLREPAKFGPWLRRITANACTMSLRKRCRSNISLDEVPEQPSTSDDARRIAARAVVREALGKLSEATRLTVTLCYINGYSHAEVADFLEVPVTAVRSRLRHAKRKLREEMIEMVSDVLGEGKPDPEFAKRVVDEAMRKAEEARASHATGDALQHYDEALAALGEIEPGEEQLRRKMDVLWQKGHASRYSPGRDESVRLMEESLAVAVQLADRKAQADKLLDIGLDSRQTDKRDESCRKALEIYRELGDPFGQGKCLMWLGSERIFSHTPAVAEGRRYYEEAIPFFEAAESHEWLAMCRATLALLDEVAEHDLSSPFKYGAGCVTLKKEPGAVEFAGDHGTSRWGYFSEASMLDVWSPFYLVSRLRKFLDDSVPVGGSWSGDAFSYSYQPLKATVTVVSNSETVTVPAGTFGNCLLTEQVTSESGLADDAPEDEKQLNRTFVCGVCRAWYAPGVGLVRLHARKQEGSEGQEGAEGTMVLREYSVEEQSTDHLPLAVGNRWVYGWADLPSNWVAKDAYEVTACQDDKYYLQRYSYAYKEAEPAE